MVGAGLADSPEIEILRLPDTAAAAPGDAAVHPWSGQGQQAKAIQPTAGSLRFVVPGDLAPGVFAFRVKAAGHTVGEVLNRPRVWWGQDDAGTTATPGGWLRLFGRNLAIDGAPAGVRPTVCLQGVKRLSLPAESDAYSARIALPPDLPHGDYSVSLHNGCGGAAAWSEPLRIHVAARQPWPSTVFDVTKFGAVGNGSKDDTPAVQASLAKAKEAGGGVVYFPRGRYKLSAALEVPRRTVLRGERQEWVALAWTDFDHPPESLVRGTNSFALEDLTLYSRNHRHVIAADLSDRPEAGDVALRRVGRAGQRLPRPPHAGRNREALSRPARPGQ